MAQGRFGLDTAVDCFPVTPDNGTDLAVEARALVIGTAGTLVVTTHNDQTRTVTVPAGVFPCRAKRVWATGTTASGITALV